MAKQLSPLQAAYSEFFFLMLQEYEVETPAKLTDEKRSEFFNQIKRDWKKKKKELAKQGIKGVNESFNKTELIKSELKKRSELKAIIKEILLKEVTETEYEVFYNRKKIIVKSSKGIWDAKQQGFKLLKVPKSKQGLVAIQSIESKENQDFRFN